jgi:eukaryotic-like serine/threonine-protein kinase
MKFGFLTFFRKSRDGRQGPKAHMTFAHTSAGRTILRTGAILKRQIWAWPIIAVVVLSAVGYSVSSAIRATMKSSFQSQLQTLLNVETSMLETWLQLQSANAEAQANSRQVRETVEKLLAATEADAADAPVAAGSSLHAQLGRDLAPVMSSQDFVGYFVTNRKLKILGSTHPELVGRTVDEYEGFLTKAIEGTTTVSVPFPSVTLMKDETGRLRTGVPIMYVAAPIRNADFQIVGVLALQIRPEREFTRILQLGRIGASGETYAFDKQGTFISNSRFDEDLILLGLLPDAAGARSILNLSVRDPGGNMLDGFRSKARRAALPLTKMAASAISGQAGVDVDGYRDYRGVPVVGAWEWLPKYEMGVATEVDYAEAFRPLNIVQWMFAGIYTLLGVSSVAIFVFTLIVAKMRREAQKAAIEAKQLGQYVLDRKLGAGAMGVVYEAHHAMLRRRTAIKMLNVDIVNDASIQRFEREVQITCQLNHPNTIAVYDYGRTPEGVFYYAMEYLNGIDLQALVDKYGPQSEARVIRILTQICGSLFEAHMQGLVHRDIKPANIMLNRRGGEPDFVKVLDFGLVKALDDKKQVAATNNGMTGTPLYMAPEAIQSPLSVDSRSDLYAVGAVGYFLLTGHPVFTAETLMELCRLHIAQTPTLPSAKLGRAVSPALEDALMSCLQKDRAKRPQTARDLAMLIAKAPTAADWSIDESDAWWNRHERGSDSTMTASPIATRPASQTASPQPSATQPEGKIQGGSGHGGTGNTDTSHYAQTYIGHSPDE